MLLCTPGPMSRKRKEKVDEGREWKGGWETEGCGIRLACVLRRVVVLQPNQGSVVMVVMHVSRYMGWCQAAQDTHAHAHAHIQHIWAQEY